MHFNWTGTTIFGMLIYGWLCTTSSTLSFNFEIFCAVILLIFGIEIVANLLGGIMNE